jgi:hypothetical protein
LFLTDVKINKVLISIEKERKKKNMKVLNKKSIGLDKMKLMIKKNNTPVKQPSSNIEEIK